MAVAVVVAVGCPAVDTRSSLSPSRAYLLGVIDYINVDEITCLQ